MQFTGPSEYCPRAGYRPIGCRFLPGLGPHQADLRGRPPVRESRREGWSSTRILSWTWLCSRVLPGRNRQRSQTDWPLLVWLTLLGFPAPSAYRGLGKRLDRACLTRLCSVFRLLPPPDALLLPKPARLCFTPVTLLGFTLQRFPLRNGRVRLSASLSLLAFPTVGSLQSAVHRACPLSERARGWPSGIRARPESVRPVGGR